uniref:Uncharacterized protein n=1 Tax=Siphoviridae sp. ctEJG5 TaxID=2827814 RepID=A0A8S5RXA2_9CAUD|nr:MAG TPA: hypothetical protein [Siphoviridae sp. ctEJG5]
MKYNIKIRMPGGLPNVNHRNQSEGKFEHFGNAFR